MFIVDVASNECLPGGGVSAEGEFESEDGEYVVFGRLDTSTTQLRKHPGLISPEGAKRFSPRQLADDLVANDLGGRTIEVLLHQDIVSAIGEWKSSPIPR